MSEVVGSIQVVATINTNGYDDGKDKIVKGNKELEKSNKDASTSFDSFKNASLVALAAVGAAAAVAFKTAIDSTGEYESSLSQLQQASGANAEQMKIMAENARTLGADTSLAGVTAADVAKSMVELSKAGLSVNDTLAASKGVLSLAKAGNIEFAEAATIAASALNAFGMSGGDATKVADALAAGANASQADLADLAMGMQQSATVAKQFGIGLNDTVTSLALFANNGIKGSDAGTSLKTMLIALAKPSKESADAMKAIGFSAYDAAGNFVGLREMSVRLQDSTKNLTKEQKQNTLATIFGTDAFRAAAILADNAGTSYDAMSTSVGKVGAATDAANAQMGPWQKAQEGLSNTFSELSLQVGQAVLPTLTQFTNNISANLIPTANNAKNVFVTMLPAIVGATAAIGAYSLITKTAAVAQGALNAVMMLNPYVAGAAAIIGLTVAMATLVGSSDSSKGAAERLKMAQDNLKVSTDNVKLAEQQVSDARLAREGSQLALEAAEARLTKLRESGTATNLELKQAEYDVKVAKDGVKKSSDAEAESVKKAADEKKKDADNKQKVIDANNEQAASAQAVADGYGNISKQISNAQDKARKSGGNVFQASLNVGGITNPTGRAVGGSVYANTPYFVGENPDGSLNSTSELFVPRSSGTIVNSSDLQGMLGGSSVSNTFNINLSGIMASSPSDERAIAKRLVERINEELRSKGRQELAIW